MILRLAILLLGLAPALPAAADPVPRGPEIPGATGEAHPEGNARMRRRHMTMMRHDRDLTLREGVRGLGASLAECFDCHAAKDAAGHFVTYEDERHFCRVCHDYAAVKVDCFMCHRSTPEGYEEPPLHALGSSPARDVQVAGSYLKQTFGTTSRERGSAE